MILALATSLAQAHGYSRPPQHHYHGGGHHRWVAPLIIGGAIGYGLSRPAPVYSYPAPPVAAPYYAEPMPTWAPPPGFHYEQRLDAGCNCWRWFVVSN